MKIEFIYALYSLTNNCFNHYWSRNIRSWIKTFPKLIQIADYSWQVKAKVNSRPSSYIYIPISILFNWAKPLCNVFLSRNSDVKSGKQIFKHDNFEFIINLLDTIFIVFSESFQLFILQAVKLMKLKRVIGMGIFWTCSFELAVDKMLILRLPIIT